MDDWRLEGCFWKINKIVGCFCNLNLQNSPLVDENKKRKGQISEMQCFNKWHPMSVFDSWIEPYHLHSFRSWSLMCIDMTIIVSLPFSKTSSPSSYPFILYCTTLLLFPNLYDVRLNNSCIFNSYRLPLLLALQLQNAITLVITSFKTLCFKARQLWNINPTNRIQPWNSLNFSSKKGNYPIPKFKVGTLIATLLEQSTLFR